MFHILSFAINVTDLKSHFDKFKYLEQSEIYSTYFGSSLRIKLERNRKFN
jgi:hypothetical protein